MERTASARAIRYDQTDVRNSQLPPRPIFIVGFPRSGTTLLQAMLAGQRGIVSFPETHYFEVADRFGLLDAESEVSSARLAEFVGKLQRTTECALPADALSDLQARAAAGGLVSWHVFETLIASLLPPAGAPAAQGDVRWLEKTPGHCAYMQTIVGWYPDAQFLCMFREPVAAIYSTHVKLAKRDGSRIAWSRLVRRWRECGEQYEEMKARRPGQILAVRYEALATGPETVLAQVSEFLRTPIDVAAAMNFHETSAGLIGARETWKDDVRSQPLRNTNGLFRVPLVMRLHLQHELRADMKRYGYPMRLGVIQRAYDAGRRAFA